MGENNTWSWSMSVTNENSSISITPNKNKLHLSLWNFINKLQPKEVDFDGRASLPCPPSSCLYVAQAGLKQ